jgi:hypothetical protein
MWGMPLDAPAPKLSDSSRTHSGELLPNGLSNGLSGLSAVLVSLPLYLLYQYKCTNTGAAAAAPRALECSGPKTY